MAEEIKTITKREAVELLRRAVEEKGADYVYEPLNDLEGGSCVYTDRDSRPSCIVGHALAYAGVPLEVLHAIDWGGAIMQDYPTDDEGNTLWEEALIEVEADGSLGETSISDEPMNYWLEKNGFRIEQAARDVFGVAQGRQDNGRSWGEAVEKAITLTTGAQR